MEHTFCKKPNRFLPAYITKICNQVEKVQQEIHKYNWEFDNVSFLDTIQRAQAGDFIYCDPPYYGRYVDYYNGWTQKDEEALLMLYCILQHILFFQHGIIMNIEIMK